MRYKIAKMFILCTFTAILSLIFFYISANVIYFNFKTVFYACFLCTLVISLIALILKITTIIKSGEFNIFDKLNFTKKLIEYTKLLEQVINKSNISICLEDKTGRRIFSSPIFDRIKTLPDSQSKTDVKINNNIYKMNSYKIQTYSGKDEFKLTTLENITEKRTEQEAQASSLAMITHDIKTPIFAISQALELICKGKFGELNPTQKEVLELCLNSSTFAKYLVGNILCSYKTDNSNINLNIEEFNLSKIIENCKNEISFLIKEKPLNINLNIPKAYTIKGDKNEIQRVILNLLYNAVTYSKPNSDIDINLNFDEIYLHFSVSNESEYIPKEDISSIFNKNFSIENKYNKPGTGLGLYVSNKIIQAHGGEMIAKSSTNNINIFGFRLKHNKIISAKSLL